MVVINGVKYACDRCIRGHRVSGCRHLDQPLKMIKRKGRPPTQCGTCKKIRSKTPNASASCVCREHGEVQPSSINDTLPGQQMQPPHRGGRGPGMQPKAELTPMEIAKLRQQPDIKIELPDGTVLGPETQNDASSYHPLPQYPMPGPPSMPHPFMPSYPVGQYPPVQHSSIPDDEYLMPDRFRYQPHYYGRMVAPYNADLYNESTGNNVAAAVMNARGAGGYAPNTGTVNFQPKLALENELATSAQDLADSLHGIMDTKHQPPGAQEETADHINDPNDPYGTVAHIPKLSNLY